MNTTRTAAGIAVVAVAAVVGKVALKALPVAGGIAAANVVAEWLGPSEMARGLRAGFGDVSDDWDGFIALWSDSSKASFYRAGAVVAARHLTNDETIRLYAWRGESFMEFADDPSKRALCGGSAVSDPSAMAAGIDIGPVARLSGRAFARQHIGEAPWRPVVGFDNEEAWIAFARYLHDNGLDDVLATLAALAEGEDVGERRLCIMQARLYATAAQHPWDTVWKVPYLHFVRSMDVLALEPLGAQ